MFASSYQVHSGFRDAFDRTFGTTPGEAHAGKYVGVQFVETPLGHMIIAAVEEGICMAEFSDCHRLEYHYQQIKNRYGLSVLPGSNPVMDRLKGELSDYFEGRLKQFSVPLTICGTPFQERVWDELLHIPYGQTDSYQAIAQRTGNVRAVRAVAGAVATNPVWILIPCHRVIGKDGGLVGYGGGLWRKRLLLELERSGKLAGA